MKGVDQNLLEEEEQIIKKSIPVEGCSGVYFLIQGNEIIYIGSSKNLFHRLGGYLGGLEKEKGFDRFYFIEAEKNEIEIIEAKYILKYLPKHNNLSKELLGRYHSIVCASFQFSDKEVPF